MRIKRLWVSKYKNITNLHVQFNSDLVSLLVGRNGLGKSNLIEILALIFRDLDLFQEEKDFKDWPYDPDHFEYEIEYECQASDLEIHSKEGRFNVFRKQLNAGGFRGQLEFRDFKAKKRTDYLPDYIIGYYSGENKRIRNIIRPYEELVWKQLKDNKDMDREFRPMFFAENYHAQMVLLTLLLYKRVDSDTEFLKAVESLIKDFGSFSSLKEFQLRLRNPSWYKGAKSLSVLNLEANLLAKEGEAPEFPFWGARGKAHKIIQFLYDNGMGQPSYYQEDGKEYLELEIDKNRVSTKIHNEFPNPSHFLDALESLETIGSIDQIMLRVRSEKRNVEFDFVSLSEGEQQMITVLGLLLITGQKDCLFLFDEPDTHLNPAWQRDFVELLHKFNLNDDNSHIFVATHSPLLVQAADENTDVILFRLDEEGNVCADYRQLDERAWRVDHVLLSKYFNLKSTRPKALDEFMEKRNKLLSKKELTDTDVALLKKWEDDFDVLPTGETLTDLRVLRKAFKYFQD